MDDTTPDPAPIPEDVPQVARPSYDELVLSHAY